MARTTAVLAAIAGGAARRPVAVLAVFGTIALAAAALSLRLHPTAATDTLVPRSSATFSATERYHRLFGDDPVIVLVRGPLRSLVLTQDLERVLGLEGCLSGREPRGVVPFGGPSGPCAQIARQHVTSYVFGPGTFLNESTRQLSDQFTAQTTAERRQEQLAANAAYRLALGRGRTRTQARSLAARTVALVRARFTSNILQIALRYGLSSAPSLNNPDFISQVVFDPLKPLGTPKARFSALFPNSESAIIQVRFDPRISAAARTHAISLVRKAVAMPEWHLTHGGRYLLTGLPVIVSDLTDSISSSLLVLLVGALLAMAATLAIVFRSRPRMMPLLIALGAAALTFGALALSGAALTMASIGVLPVLIGLAVDYAIQFQSRVDEAGTGAVDAVAGAARRGAATIAIAGAATAGGFLVLALPIVGSPVPMVRDFALLLVVGIVLAFACALSAGAAAIVLARRNTAGRPLPLRVGRPAARATTAVAASLRGAAELVTRNGLVLALRDRTRRGAGTAFAGALARPERALAIAALLAVCGWALDTQTSVESNIQRLVPQSLPALRSLDELQRSTHVGGEIDVLVTGADVASPTAVHWMTDYQTRVLGRLGYSAKRGCGSARLCPAFSLPDLFGAQSGQPSATDIQSLLAVVPQYFSQGVITADRRAATLAFGIRLMGLEQQKRVIDTMRSELHPPRGIAASLVGLPVLAADANAGIASPWRRAGTLLAGLAAVALVLLLALRTARRALVPLVPIALATGWSALLLFITRVPLNPMSVTLGTLVLAISTEFSVLLAERYRDERAAGHGPGEALGRTYASTGRAVLASGATAIVGFAVLMLSNIRMLRDFGFVTVIDLTVSLLGVMLVLPSVLLLAEPGRRAGLSLRRLARRSAATESGATS